MFDAMFFGEMFVGGGTSAAACLLSGGTEAGLGKCIRTIRHPLGVKGYAGAGGGHGTKKP